MCARTVRSRSGVPRVTGYCRLGSRVGENCSCRNTRSRSKFQAWKTFEGQGHMELLKDLQQKECLYLHNIVKVELEPAQQAAYHNFTRSLKMVLHNGFRWTLPEREQGFVRCRDSVETFVFNCCKWHLLSKRKCHCGGLKQSLSSCYCQRKRSHFGRRNSRLDPQRDGTARR